MIWWTGINSKRFSSEPIKKKTTINWTSTWNIWPNFSILSFFSWRCDTINLMQYWMCIKQCNGGLRAFREPKERHTEWNDTWASYTRRITLIGGFGKVHFVTRKGTEVGQGGMWGGGVARKQGMWQGADLPGSFVNELGGGRGKSFCIFCKWIMKQTPSLLLKLVTATVISLSRR